MSTDPREQYVVRIERGGKEIACVTQGADGAPAFNGEPLATEAAFRLCGALLAPYILVPDDAPAAVPAPVGADCGTDYRGQALEPHSRI